MRAAWLQVHKCIGLTLAILIVPISLTGAALVWHDWLDAKLEPQRSRKPRQKARDRERLARLNGVRA